MPASERLLGVNVSGELVVWPTEFGWKGYDLVRQALFTIPEIPPGVFIGCARSVKIVPYQDNVVWIIDTGWTTSAYFAPVVDQTPAIQPAASLTPMTFASGSYMPAQSAPALTPYSIPSVNQPAP